MIVAVLVTAGIAAALLSLASNRTSASSNWVLTYTKPDGPGGNDHFNNVGDPAPNAEVNEFVARVAAECRVDQFTVEYQYTTDVNDRARVIIPQTTAAERACFQSRVRPPYVTFERVPS